MAMPSVFIERSATALGGRRNQKIERRLDLNAEAVLSFAYFSSTP
jgi:hypothetical protein